ncbi:MAG: anthranilate synthase component I family protein, partial [Bacteroidota bacterium]
MRKIEINTVCKKLLADVFTPVGIYLRLRDRFRDTILLESTDHHAAENSYSFICINAIGGIEITSKEMIEFKIPGENPEKVAIKNVSEVPKLIWDFMQRFEVSKTETSTKSSGLEGAAKFAQGLFGYTAYDAVQFFETVRLTTHDLPSGQAGSQLTTIPLMRYRFYQYVIAINHFNDELYICENILPGLNSELMFVESLIRGKDIPVYPFKIKGEETSNL